MFKKLLNRKTLRKVPEITIFFWIIKLLTTAMGESVSDFLVHHMNPIIAVILAALSLIIILIIQLFVKKYIAWIYWLTASMVAVFGTMAADAVHIVIGIPYLFSTIFFAITLIIIFFIWYKFEKTLSIHSIITLRKELFYWATIITTFALGTAMGDMTAATFGWGYLLSGIIFGILFILPIIGYKFLKLNEVMTFWLAYIITRPFGASFADWFGRTPNLGGIGFGTGKTSLVLIILIIIFITYLSITRSDTKKIN